MQLCMHIVIASMIPKLLLTVYYTLLNVNLKLTLYKCIDDNYTHVHTLICAYANNRSDLLHNDYTN